MGGGFSVNQMPASLDGKVAIVTGATSGIGYETALVLASRRAHVILASRDKERSQEAEASIRRRSRNQKVEWMELRLDSLRSVRDFCEAFRRRRLPLHMLINNAGVMACPFRLSEDGIESQFATNHLGHFLLTTSLLDLLERSAPSRIVNVSSSLHSSASRFPFERINEEAAYEPLARYDLTKLCNVLFSRELAKRIGDKQIYVNSLHPGLVSTKLFRSFGSSYGAPVGAVVSLGKGVFGISQRNGALTTLYCATSPEIEDKNYRGQYFVPYGSFSTCSALGRDDQYAEELWVFSERLVKEKLAALDASESSLDAKPESSAASASSSE